MSVPEPGLGLILCPCLYTITIADYSCLSCSAAGSLIVGLFAQSSQLSRQLPRCVLKAQKEAMSLSLTIYVNCRRGTIFKFFAFTHHLSSARCLRPCSVLRATDWGLPVRSCGRHELLKRWDAKLCVRHRIPDEGCSIVH